MFKFNGEKWSIPEMSVCNYVCTLSIKCFLVYCRLHESEQMEEFHRDKIRELSEDLSQFRQAVEVVAGEHPDEQRSRKDRSVHVLSDLPCITVNNP